MTPSVTKVFTKGAKVSSKARHQFAFATSGAIVGAPFFPALYNHDPVELKMDHDDIVQIPPTRPEELSEAIAIFEGNYAGWTLEESVFLFDPDKSLEAMGDEEVISNGLYEEVFNFGEQKACFSACKRKVKGYENTQYSKQQEAVRWYLNKIFCYLHKKQKAFEDGPNRPAGKLGDVCGKVLATIFGIEMNTDSEKVALENLIERVSLSIVDMHIGCIDQTLSQIRWLALEIVDDSGHSSMQKRMALDVMNYRDALIKEVVNETKEPHAADLYVELAKTLYKELKIPLPEALKSGAAHKTIYQPQNSTKAKAEFYRRYKPVKYLVDECQRYTQNILFTYLCEWYSKNYFPEDLCEETELARIALLGTDFSSPELFGKRKDSAVYYWLHTQGIIKAL